MNEEGIKLAQPGKDVSTARDSEMIFNSSWPTLKLIANIRVQAIIPPHPPNPTVLFRHNLGYVPAFLSYLMAPNFGGFAVQPTPQMSLPPVAADEENIYWTLNTNSISNFPDLGILVFAVPILTDYTAPDIKLGSSSGSSPDPDFGLKISKPGADISSSDLRDFAIHSATRGPLLHAVRHGPTNNPDTTLNFARTFSYLHDLPYQPIFMTYLSSLQGGSPYTLVNAYSGVSSGNKITVLGGSGQIASIVVLKDPFNIDDNIINVSL